MPCEPRYGQEQRGAQRCEPRLEPREGVAAPARFFADAEGDPVHDEREREAKRGEVRGLREVRQWRPCALRDSMRDEGSGEEREQTGHACEQIRDADAGRDELATEVTDALAALRQAEDDDGSGDRTSGTGVVPPIRHIERDPAVD